ncbi:MAG: D-Ala-D-Ala carboxypeptidase family metallohydrolase [Woeseia sp.]
MKRLAPAALTAWFICASPAVAWESERLQSPVTVNRFEVRYPELAIFVMPRSPIQVTVAERATLLFMGQHMPAMDAALKAPARPGLEIMEIENEVTGEIARINVFTMVPASAVRNGRLNGYRIGHYPAEPLRGLDIYRPPQGFVEVTEENRDIRVSPNFTLGEFVAKQVSDWPKYVVLRTALLVKLETILEELNASGRPTGSLVIMSGYRTPHYNRAIGNVQYSRHVWGGAADFYIDEAPADGRMDDLNKDGKINKQDARWLANFVNGLSQKGLFGEDVGGIGVYSSTSAHGPFVHVDVRGTRARW